LHQRPLKERIRKIIALKKIEKINDHFFIIEITASAGTYIKEFINGDFGRTWPNLGSLLNCECDILQLDVKDIFY
jgi:tRNA pseudouridine synthase 10